MTMAQADAFDWFAMDAFTERRRRFEPTNIHVRMGEGEPMPEGSWELLDEQGDLVTTERLMEFIHEIVPWDDEDKLPDSPKTVGIVLQNEFTVRTPDGRLYKAHQVEAEVTYTIAIEAKAFTLHKYTGSGTGEGVDLSFASTDLKIGDINGKFVFARQADGTTDISWQPDPADLKPPKPVRRRRAPKFEGKP